MTDHIHVLYIDNDLTILDIAKQFLELTGEYSVTPVDNAVYAIQLHSEKAFDAIVSDYEMEKMNGIELLKHLREKGDTTPFIIFTGKGREEVVIEALNSGADFYLQKGGQPTSQFTELSNKIRYAVLRRRAEKELSESQKKTADIIEFLPDATFVVNIEGVVIAWNRAIEDMTGIRKEEMIGQGDHAYMIPFYGKRRHSLLYLIDHDDEDLISKYQYVHKRGNTLYAELYSPTIFKGKGAYLWVTGAPLFDMHGTRIGAIESIRDITERKLTENDLLRKNEELQTAYEEIVATEEELRGHLDEVTRQEQLVRKSEEQFQSLYMNMIDGAALHNLIYTNQGIPEDYVIIRTNPAFEKQLGISSDTVIGKTSREAYGVTEPPYLEIYARVVMTGEPEVFETFFSPLEKYFSISVYCPFKGSFATIFEDITPRKLAEIELLKKNEELQAAFEEIAATEEELCVHLDEVNHQKSILKKHEQRLLMAQEIGQTGCWELDLTTGLIWGSDEAFRIFGTPRTEDGFLSLDEVEAVIPERKRVHQALMDLITDGVEYDLEYLIHPADGSDLRIVHSVARFEKDGSVNQRVMGIIQDVTRRKEAEELLRQTNAYLENLIAIANVPIIVWDPSFRITRLNHAFEHLIGRSGEEVIGNPLEFLFPPDQAERSIRLFRTTQDGVRWETVEIDIQHRDGSLRTLLWNSATLYSPDGVTPVATIAQGHDITEVRKLEQEKDAALLQIQQNLSYLAILNDEIRNPLTIILTLADMIGDPGVFDEICCQTRRIDEMVNQLDKRWIDSEKVLNAIRKHYQIQAVSPERQVSEETGSIFSRKKEILIEEVQAQLYTILDSIDALVYVADIETHDILFMNHRGRSLFGNIAGQKCFQSIYNFQEVSCSFCTNNRLIDEFGPTGVYQWEFLNPRNGRWYDCRDRAIRWSDGRLVRLEIATDITERKRVELDLISAQESLKEVHTLAHFGTWDWLIETDTVTWSKELYEIAGRDPHLSAPTYAEHPHLYTPSSWEQLEKAVTRALLTGEPYNLELELIRPDGSNRWTQEFGGVKRDENDAIIMLHGMVQDITQRKEAEQALMESEEKYRRLHENAGIGIGYYTPDGTVISYNLVAAGHMGGCPEDFAGKSIFDLFTKEDAERYYDRILKAVGSDESIEYEDMVPLPTGDIYFLSTFTRITDSEDDVVGIQIISQDITKRKHAEESLRREQARLEVAMAMGNIAWWEMGLPDGRIRFHERKATILGYLPSQFHQYSDFTSLLHPDDYQKVMHVMHEHLKGNATSYDVEYRIRTADGSYRWFHDIGGITERDSEDKPVIVSGMVLDITKEKSVSFSLQVSEEKFRSIFDMMNDGMHIHEITSDGTPGKFIDVNEVACKMLHYTREEMLEHSPLDFVTGYHNRPLDEIIRELSTTNHAIFETEHRRKDGTIIPVEINSHKVSLQGKQMIISVVRDITDRKQVEETLVESNKKLRLLTSLTRHDIFNQLTAGHLYLDLALGGADSKEVKQNISRAYEANRRIESIIRFTREYEDFGIISSGWYRISPIIDSAKTQVHLGNVSFENNIPDNLEIYADPIIRKVFTTLLENAIRHGGTIKTIRFFYVECIQTEVIICEDDGIGIPLHEKDHIFKHRYGKHTGIGLFLAREILSITGLSIRECGVPGKGARFEILVPKGKFRYNREPGR